MDKAKIEELLKVDLLKELKLEGLDELAKQGVVDDAVYIIVRGAWIKIFEALSSEKQAEFSKILDGSPEDADAILGFLKKEVPNYEDIIKEQIAEYKSVLLAK